MAGAGISTESVVDASGYLGMKELTIARVNRVCLMMLVLRNRVAFPWPFELNRYIGS